MGYKKFILTSLLLVVSLSCFCQGVKLSNSRISYDENFSPTVTLTATNYEYSTITTIEFRVWYVNDHLDPLDTLRNDAKYVTVRTNISSYGSTTLSFRIPVGKNGFKPYRVDVYRVRFSDGTVKNFD